MRLCPWILRLPWEELEQETYPSVWPWLWLWHANNAASSFGILQAPIGGKVENSGDSLCTTTSTSGPLLPEGLGPWLGAVCCVWTAVLCSRAGILSAPQSWNNKLWTCVKQSNESHAQSQFLVDATSLCISVQCTVQYTVICQPTY